jgi:hypothetical protein
MEILAAVISAVAPTTMAALAWRNARAAKHQTNGALHGPISEIKADVAEIRLGLAEHREEHHRNA